MSTTYAYTRLSADRSGADETLRTQLETCERLAVSAGLTINVHVQEGSGQSAYKGEQPELFALFDKLGAGDTLILWEISRATRNARTLGRLLVLAESGVRVICPSFDTSQPAGSALMALLGSMASQESRDRSQRIRDGKQRSRDAHRWVGGRTPHGMLISDDGYLVTDPETADAARAVIQRYIDGATILSLCETMRELRTERSWRSQAVRSWLRNPALAGIDKQGNRIAEWEPLISVSQHRKVLAVAKKNRGDGQYGRRRPGALLSGLGTCGGCGYGLAFARANNYYRCTAMAHGHSCPTGLTIHADALDDYVTTRVRQVMSSLDPESDLAFEVAALLGVIDTEADDRREQLSERLAEVRHRMEKVNELFNSNVLSSDQYADAIATPAQDERDLLAELSKIPERTSIDLTTVLDPASELNLTLETARELVKLLVTVSVKSTGSVQFTPERVVITQREMQ